MCHQRIWFPFQTRAGRGKIPDGEIFHGPRGDADAGSDWDLLVIVDKAMLSSAEEDDYTYSFYELGWKLGEEINPVLYTDAQWQQRSSTPFYKNVMSEGIVLWQS